MKYVKIETILPDNLVREIQKYIQGEYIYVPSQLEQRKNGEKIQAVELIYKIEMKIYAISMRVDIKLRLYLKIFFFL